MLATLARALPVGNYLYEPKWDGFRCLAFVTADGEVELQSRHGRPLGRYVPEVRAALAALGRSVVLDGELVVVSAHGFDFATLLGRLHPSASRVDKLAREAPATFVAFDLLADGEVDLRGARFADRRVRLEVLLAHRPAPALRLTPITSDLAVAGEWLARFQGRGVDGVVAKPRDLRYAPGKRAMIKVKHERTVDCVVAGVRRFGDQPVVGALLLGLYHGDELRHVGVSSSFPMARRRALLDELRPLVVPLAGHPWERGFNLGSSPTGRLPGAAGRWVPGEMTQDWIPLHARLVCEVAYDQVDGTRFRHPARFVRWRPDRTARSCGLDQLDAPVLPAEQVLR